MRIAYCTNVRLPSERAHGHQIADVCNAFISLKHAVTMYAPFRKNPIQEQFYKYYHVDPSIELKHLGTFDPINRRFLPGVTALWTLNLLLRRNLKKVLRKQSFDLLYTRTPALLGTLLRTGTPLILELHQLPRWGRRKFVRQCRRCRLVACLTSPMRVKLLEWGVPEKKVIVEGDAVDLKRFASMPSKDAARKKWKIASDRMVVGYVGRLKTLSMEKGVGILLRALRSLQKKGSFFGFIVGGPAGDQKEYEAEAEELRLTENDVCFAGEIAPKDVPSSLAACDVLAMPFPDLPHYRQNMSPLKMFEYMASGRPIIASDLPTVRDVLSEKTCIFCTPGDVQSLRDALEWVKANPEEAAARAAKAHELVKRHTWEERMKRILSTATLKA